MDELEYLQKQIEDLKDESKENSSCRIEVEKKLIEIEASMKSFHKRIDKVEQQTEAITEIALATKSISEKVEKTISLLETHHEKIDALEKAPGELLKKYSKVFIASLLTGVAGAMITNLINNKK